MTQEELAERTFIPKTTISNYENDRIDIKSSVIAELANALQTVPNYLILGEKATKADNGFMRMRRQSCFPRS
jgi:transcriptional regulator with XRE-family HTH domain